MTASNYLDVYPYEKWTDKSIGAYSLGSTYHPDAYSVAMKAGQTCPPQLLSEPELIGTMDKNGIGTPLQ